MKSYPKTPRWDKACLNLNENLLIQEKMDGGNISISFDNSDLILTSRRRELGGPDKNTMYKELFRITYANKQQFKEVLGSKYKLFCEYLAIQHKIKYINLPSCLCALDVWDKENKVFLSRKEMQSLVANLPVFFSPEIWSGKYKNLPGSFFDKIKSSYAEDGIAEGAYIRIENKDTCTLLAFKLVSEDFGKIKSYLDDMGNKDYDDLPKNLILENPKLST